jgi:hypothetical protein
LTFRIWNVGIFLFATPNAYFKLDFYLLYYFKFSGQYLCCEKSNDAVQHFLARPLHLGMDCRLFGGPWGFVGEKVKWLLEVAKLQWWKH